MARWVVVGSGVFGVVVMSVVGHAGQVKPAPAKSAAAAKALKNPVPVSTDSIGSGKAVFAKYCRSCHGLEGKGDGPGAALLENSKPADLTDAKWDHGSTDGEIFATIHDGVGPDFEMDSWEGRVQDKDIWNMVNYIRTLKAGAMAAEK